MSSYPNLWPPPLPLVVGEEEKSLEPALRKLEVTITHFLSSFSYFSIKILFIQKIKLSNKDYLLLIYTFMTMIQISTVTKCALLAWVWEWCGIGTVCPVHTLIYTSTFTRSDKEGEHSWYIGNFTPSKHQSLTNAGGDGAGDEVGCSPLQQWVQASKRERRKRDLFSVVRYRPFHKTLPRTSAFVNWISVRFYETDCTRNITILALVVRPPRVWPPIFP